MLFETSNYHCCMVISKMKLGRKTIEQAGKDRYIVQVDVSMY